MRPETENVFVKITDRLELLVFFFREMFTKGLKKNNINKKNYKIVLGKLLDRN